jgi:hypothetical protein
MSILLYVRRKAGLAFATMAVLLSWAAVPTLYYAVEARPYALIFLCFACLLLSWDEAIQTRPRKLALFGIAVATLVLLLAHVFTAFTLLSFAVAAVVRFVQQRKADYALWAAFLLPTVAIAVYLPILQSCGKVIFPNHATWNTIVLFFQNTFTSPVIAFALLFVLLLPPGKQPIPASTPFRSDEIALFACLILGSPLLLTAYLMHRQGTFYDRYCIPSQVAILIVLAVLLHARVRASRWAVYAACVLIASFLFKNQVWHALRYPVPRNASFLASIDQDLPLVIGEGQVFMEMNQYESAPLLNRLYFLKDPQASMQYRHTNIFQEFVAPDVMREAGFPFPAHITKYSDFVGLHRRFLYLGNPGQWVFAKAAANGATVTFIGNYNGAMPYFDTDLFLVSLPSQ